MFIKALRRDWLIHVFALVFIPIFIGLGLWQLSRKDEKVALEKAYQARLMSQQVPVEAVIGQNSSVAGESAASVQRLQSLQFLPVEVRGTLLPAPVILLENRYIAGKLGFELLRPVQLNTGREKPSKVLVNFGWLPSPLSRDDTPALPALPETIQLQGSIFFTEKNPLAGDKLTPYAANLVRVIDLDLEEISQRSSHDLADFVVRIDPADKLALKTDWKIANTRAQKHFGYAVQWFAMALALAVLWFLALRRVRSD